MTPEFAPDNAESLPLWLIWSGKDGPDLSQLDGDIRTRARDWAGKAQFTGAAGKLCLLPGADGGLAGALFGMGPRRAAADRPARDRFPLARAVAQLPAGVWHLAGADGPDFDPEMAALGWLLGQYAFDRYKPSSGDSRAMLKAPAGADAARALAMARAEFLTRDLINTPSNDMGPDQIEAAARDLAKAHDARITVTAGDDLPAANLPMIHAVGRASSRAPRLIDLRFGGTAGPRVTLVGKGVAFDTGGLDIKPAAGMALMKKDMGGAATVLGLAQLLAETGATKHMQLRVLIPAVENAISGNAMRPGDVLTSRKGLTVEINNTDAEGRLILADALALAAEEKPQLLISMATLTGAARVALGPDLPPFFCDDDSVAAAIHQGGQAGADPVWRMPFWEPYEPMIEPLIADLDNAPGGGFAGAITAALFLRRFAEGARHYAHFDIYGWTPAAAPGRPKGGVAQGARAIFNALPEILPGLSA
ncbi:leucyl aminopeptidase family protein [Paracoccus pacificus]|uniref:Leucyl aminopeptidase family protein n=1 Tax=Paracoccus pacificus TaxID=1463598 RepID=A0ABW4RBX4_9RHOB